MKKELHMPLVRLNYSGIDGNQKIVSLNNLKVVVEGSVEIGPLWFGERINYSPESHEFIEFQEGPEVIPGFPQSKAVQVTAEYVKAAYGVTDKQLLLAIRTADAKMAHERSRG